MRYYIQEAMTCTTQYMKRYNKRYVEREKEVERKGKTEREMCTLHTLHSFYCVQ